jgi:hypothetical protein
VWLYSGSAFSPSPLRPNLLGLFRESMLAEQVPRRCSHISTAASKEIGNEWIKSGRSAVLSLPSVLVRLERTLLLNPKHADFRKIELRIWTTFSGIHASKPSRLWRRRCACRLSGGTSLFRPTCS